jgi:hypothetical protein
VIEILHIDGRVIGYNREYNIRASGRDIEQLKRNIYKRLNKIKRKIRSNDYNFMPKVLDLRKRFSSLFF